MDAINLDRLSDWLHPRPILTLIHFLSGVSVTYVTYFEVSLIIYDKYL